MLGCSVHTLPSFALRDAMLTMLVCATHWLFMHLYTLAYMFMHESCLLVLSMLQHNEVMDIRSKPTFVPHRHHPFVCFLACLPSCLFACFLVPLLAMSIMLIYLMPLSYALCTFSLHHLFAGFLILLLHVHTWSEDT